MNVAAIRVTVDGNDYDSKSGNQVTTCTTTNTPCDDANSVVLGASSYRSGNNAAIYDITLNETANCIDSDLKIRLDMQANGPNTGSYSGTPNYGWVGGRNVSESSDRFATMSKIVVYAHDWNGNSGSSDWDMIDANTKVKFNTNSYGTIATTNRGTGFAVEVIDMVKAGSVSLTGRTGVYVQNQTNGDDPPVNSSLKIRVLNDPQTDWYASNGHLRTEIKSVAVDYENETVDPSNPYGSETVSSSPTHSREFPKNQWTQTRAFQWNQTHSAQDECEFDHLEYTVLPVSVNPNTATGFSYSTTSNSREVSRAWIPQVSTSGEYKFWYRAVDRFGNEAAWDSDQNFVILYDITDPIAGTTTVNYPASGWFSETYPPQLSWTGWSDAHAGIAYYHVILNNNVASNLSNTTASYTHNQWSDLACSNQNKFKLKAYDVALPVANVRTTPSAFNVKFDNCDPTPAAVVLPANGWYTTNTPGIQFSQASEPSAQSGIHSCVLAVDNASVLTIPSSTCASGGSVSHQLLDGVVQAHIRTCDLAGNCANGTQQLIRVDTVLPTLQTSVVRSPTRDVWSQTNELNLSLSFTDSNSQNNVQVSEMANVYAGVFPSTTIPSLNQVQNGGYSTSCATNSCTLDVEQTLTDGNHSLWYVAKDKAGNVLGPSKLSGHFLVDTVGPSSTTPYFAANITNQTSMNLLWLASQDSNSGLAGYVLNVTQASTSTVTTYNLGPTTSQNITGLSDGNYSACLTPVDEADNYGQASCTTTSLWVDTTAPTLQAWSDVAGWTTSTRVNVSWEAYDSSQTTEVRYNLDSSGFSQAFSENDTVMLSSLSVGLHHVLVRANDSAGNTQEVLVTFGVDVAGPTIVASHDLGPLWTNQTQHTITWNITDAHSGVERISLYQSGSLVATNLSANGSWAFNLTAGVHNLSIFAVDEVGHESWWTTNARVDTATPSVSCLVSPAGWSNTMPSFYLNILANGSLSNVAHVATYDGVLFSAPTSGWHTLPTSLDGIHVVAVTVSNQGGNSVTCSVNVYYDTTPPVFTAPPQLPAVTAASMLNLSVSVDDVHAGVAELLWEVDNITLQASSTSTASLDIASFSEGTKSLRITATDHAGNQRDWTSTFVLDRTAPTIDTFELASSVHNGWLNQSTALINLEASDNLDSAVETVLLVNGVATAYTGSSTTLALPDGTSTLGFRVTDHAGLTAYQEFDVRVDTVAPGCELSSEVPSTAWSNDASREITAQYWAGNSSVVSRTSTLNGQVIPGPNPPTLFNIPLENGINTLSVVQTGGNGLIGGCSITQWLDEEQDVAVLEVSQSLGNYGDGLVEMNLSTATNGLSNGTLELFINDELVFNALYAGDFTDSATFDLPTGVHTVYIQTEDEAGNVFVSEETSVTVMLDYSPPQSICFFEDIGGVRTQLLRSEGATTVVELPYAQGTSINKILCEATDANPLSYKDGLGSGTITQNGLPSDDDQLVLDASSVAYLIAPKPHGPFDAVQVFEVTLEDMWGNSITHSHRVLFIDAQRAVSLSCIDDEVAGIKWEEEERTCTVHFPKFEPNDGPKLNMVVDYAFEELGFSSQLLVNGEAVQLILPLEFSGLDNGETVEFYELLDIANHDEFMTSVSVQFLINSTAGKPLSESIKVKFEPCKDSDMFVPNYTTRTCEPATYIGPEFTHVQEPVGAKLDRGTNNVSLSHITPFNQHGDKSTCSIDGRTIPIPATDANLLWTVEQGQQEIDIQCTDAFGHQKQQKIQLIWETPEEDDGLLGGLSPAVLAGGGLGVIIVLLGALVVRRPKKSDSFSAASPHSQDGGEVLPSSPTATPQSSGEASGLEAEGQGAPSAMPPMPVEEDGAPAPPPDSAMPVSPAATNLTPEHPTIQDPSTAEHVQPQPLEE